MAQKEISPSNIRFWLGRGGLAHELGVGVLGVVGATIGGPQGAQAGLVVGQAIGAGQEIGIEALENRDKENAVRRQAPDPNQGIKPPPANPVVAGPPANPAKGTPPL